MLGAYVVRAGDTLGALAAQTGVSVAQMAFVNGIDAQSLLQIGTVLKLPNGAPAPLRASQPVPAVRVVPDAAPVPTPGILTAERVRQLASRAGRARRARRGDRLAGERLQQRARVVGERARRHAGHARNLGTGCRPTSPRGPLNPTSAEDNVRAGSLYLARLLRETGGDVRLAAAAYYQGLSSLRSRGMFDDTKRYVDNVMMLSARFGGL